MDAPENPWPGMGGTFADPMSNFMQLPDQSFQDEDWEDWLRWEPTADASSPGDGTVKSNSSKNHSPIQEHAFPVDVSNYTKASADETLAPPLVVGQDMIDFGTTGFGGENSDDTCLFGNMDGNNVGFNFESSAIPFPPLQNPLPHTPADVGENTWLHAPIAQGKILSSTGSSERITTHRSPASTVSSTTASYQASPESLALDRTSPSANSIISPDQSSKVPAPKKKGGRKRKADSEREKEERESVGDSPVDGEEPPVKKTSHNVIEKRYRNNLNDKIIELRNSVPSLRALGKAHGGEDSEDLEGLTPAHKLNKATVMGKATEYIRHLEKRNKSMSDEMAALKARLAAVEAAIGRTSDSAATNETVRSRQASTCSISQPGPSSMLAVPQEAMRYGQPIVPQSYAHPTPLSYPRGPDASQRPSHGGRKTSKGRNGGAMSKVVMGAMAGLMVMEGLTEQQDDGRAMFAIPTELIRRGFTAPHASASFSALPLLKTALVLGVLLYLLAPLVTLAHRSGRKTRSAVRLPPAPGLASPVEVRRKAWLTAVQTVYVRKHFLLEVASVTLKMAMLSACRVIGPEAYRSLTGTSKEDEAARIKAWDIAIDAQLAGGDAEVSYYRLLLTLMASGTLPDSPTRLMQKAVHFRVFFWEVANAGYGNIFGFRSFTERVGKFYWESARRLQKELVHARAQGRPRGDDEEEDDEALPDHLASLLELDCDDVLNDEMVQRAWNLAWNKPSAFGTTANIARDGVVEDHAIRSPLDAVAAWYANMTIDDALLDTLGEHPSTWDADYCIGIAVSIAPPASATQGRALAAKAVMSNMNREANIIAALDALPGETPAYGSMNLVSHTPAAPDVCTALTFAKLLSLFAPNAPGTARVRGQEMLARLRVMPANFTLLSAVAVYRVLKIVDGDRRLSPVAMYCIEDLAASLRIWIGTAAGQRSGLATQDMACGKLVDTCLDVAKKFGGWEEQDSGYGSAEGSPARSKAPAHGQ